MSSWPNFFYRGAINYLKLLFVVYMHQKRNITVAKAFAKTVAKHVDFFFSVLPKVTLLKYFFTFFTVVQPQKGIPKTNSYVPVTCRLLYSVFSHIVPKKIVNATNVIGLISNK